MFPQFAATRADLVCDGVMPIDQLREHTGPTALVVKRIPKEVLEGVYGLSIRTRGPEEGGDGKVTAEDLLIAYASELRSASFVCAPSITMAILSCQRLHPFRPGKSRRVSRSSLHPERLRQCEAVVLPPTTRGL